jgi:hypothetical protein
MVVCRCTCVCLCMCMCSLGSVLSPLRWKCCDGTILHGCKCGVSVLKDVDVLVLVCGGGMLDIKVYMPIGRLWPVWLEVHEPQLSSWCLQLKPWTLHFQVNWDQILV